LQGGKYEIIRGAKMKRPSLLVGLVVLLVIGLSLPAFSYDRPYKLGKGRYLTSKDEQGLCEDISKHASDEFKKAYAKALKEQSKFLGTKTPDVKFIEFIKLDKMMGPPPLEREGRPLYMVSLNGQEGIPEKEAEMRKKGKAEYYDIWVISGHIVMFEKDLNTGKFNFLGAGAVE
jgi:hypothetical protein